MAGRRAAFRLAGPRHGAQRRLAVPARGRRSLPGQAAGVLLAARGGLFGVRLDPRLVPAAVDAGIARHAAAGLLSRDAPAWAPGGARRGAAARLRACSSCRPCAGRRSTRPCCSSARCRCGRSTASAPRAGLACLLHGRRRGRHRRHHQGRGVPAAAAAADRASRCAASLASTWPADRAGAAGAGGWRWPAFCSRPASGSCRCCSAVAQSGAPELVAYRDEILLQQTVERYAGAWHHVQPWYFFLVEVVPPLWLPASALLFWLVPRWRRDFSARRADVWLPLFWVLAVLLFFSASPGKRGVYLLPALPALVLAASAHLEALMQRRGVGRVSLALAALLALAGWAWSSAISQGSHRCRRVARRRRDALDHGGSRVRCLPGSPPHWLCRRRFAAAGLARGAGLPRHSAGAMASRRASMRSALAPSSLAARSLQCRPSGSSGSWPTRSSSCCRSIARASISATAAGARGRRRPTTPRPGWWPPNGRVLLVPEALLAALLQRRRSAARQGAPWSRDLVAGDRRRRRQRMRRQGRSWQGDPLRGPPAALTSSRFRATTLFCNR